MGWSDEWTGQAPRRRIHTQEDAWRDCRERQKRKKFKPFKRCNTCKDRFQCWTVCESNESDGMVITTSGIMARIPQEHVIAKYTEMSEAQSKFAKALLEQFKDIRKE